MSVCYYRKVSDKQREADFLLPWILFFHTSHPEVFILLTPLQFTNEWIKEDNVLLVFAQSSILCCGTFMKLSYLVPVVASFIAAVNSRSFIQLLLKLLKIINNNLKIKKYHLSCNNELLLYK